MKTTTDAPPRSMLAAAVLAGVFGLAAATPAAAAECGLTVHRGDKVVLDSDVGPCDGNAIIITGPATLDLNGHTVSCVSRDGTIGSTSSAAAPR